MSDNESSLILLRPTLIIGLGGTGGKVALELKARLKEEFGGDYQQMVRFLYFDTATENLMTYQPNNPELGEVRLLPGSEFVRVSDVPLHDLMRTKAKDPAMAAILPEILHSTQIDQGAQQVRRLGRVAFFYHYSHIKQRLSDTISELHDPALSKSSSRFRVSDKLRVFLISSICGGTGGGMFIDMAYLVRRLASGSTSSTREVDIVGMLMLPEAFPEIKTTGEARIRANAYAGLLDLEYYHRPVMNNEPLDIVHYPTETVRFEGTPFSLCYLISGIGPKWELRGNTQLAPVLADVLQTMISTRVGEKLDATLDNLRSYVLHQYPDGFRTFYSVVGIAQLIYPRVWLEKQIRHRLAQKLIEDHITNTRITKPKIESVLEWYRDTLEDKKIHNLLQQNLPDSPSITMRLIELQREVGRSDESNQNDLPGALQAAYDDAMRQFQQQTAAQMQNNQADALQQLKTSLSEQVRKEVDDGGGLRWTLDWLDELKKKVNQVIESLRRQANVRSDNLLLIKHLNEISEAESIPTGIGRMLAYQRTRKACRELIADVSHTRLRTLLDSHTYEILRLLLVEIDTHQQAVNRSLEAWQQAKPQPLNDNQPNFTKLKHSVLGDTDAKNLIEEAVNNISQMEGVQTELWMAIGGLSRALKPEEHRECVLKLEAFCAQKARSTQSGNVSEFIKENDPKLLTMGEQAQPLLIYRQGYLLNNLPSQIGVIGAKSEEDASNIQKGLYQTGDITPVGTGDDGLITYLTTHHGIPANTLNHFEEYGHHYHELRLGSRGAIFHLDNARESQPYNPESEYFFTPDDLQMAFAKALGFGWIVRLEKAYPQGRSDVEATATLFVFSPDFKLELEKRLRQEISRLENELTNPEEESTSRMADEAKKLFRQSGLSEMKEYLTKWVLYVGQPPVSTTDADRGFPVMRMRTLSPAETLEQAWDAFWSHKPRILPALFIQVVDTFYETSRHKDWDDKAQEFVNLRVHPNDSSQFTPRWTSTGQVGYQIERRMVDLLSVYLRTRPSKGKL